MTEIECQQYEPRHSKLNVLLDLDNTIINSLAIPEEYKKVPQEYQDKFKYYDMEKDYRIFERPHLQIFLDYLFQNYDVSIFTAADKEYAVFIYENIIKRPHRKIHYMFSGYHSSLSEIYYNSPKDLNILWKEFKIHKFNPCNTIIIDDLDDVYLNNPYNSIPAVKFEILNDNNKIDYNAINDTFLIDIAIKKIEAFKNNMIKHPCLTHTLNENSYKCRLMK